MRDLHETTEAAPFESARPSETQIEAVADWLASGADSAPCARTRPSHGQMKAVGRWLQQGTSEPQRKTQDRSRCDLSKIPEHLF